MRMDVFGFFHWVIRFRSDSEQTPNPEFEEISGIMAAVEWQGLYVSDFAHVH